ncbi:hypothetical protein F511_43876 [Dorcoceras hygrometricum]|uniref:Uncharacterized protein n=1 Tax=Dorcoceras hygrometricum TaxID=472368 RepID=A0A2Z7AM60_9LAMI|nr:hypothetical protein F511_43876 [Dorcoceras hygrometricum]
MGQIGNFKCYELADLLMLASKVRCDWYQQVTPKSDARAGLNQSKNVLRSCEELLRLDDQSRAMVNAGQSFELATGCVSYLALVVRCSLRLLVPAFVFLNQRLVFQLREIVRYCSLQLVVVTVASDWMAYAMRRRFGLAWFGISAASFFASAG